MFQFPKHGERRIILPAVQFRLPAGSINPAKYFAISPSDLPAGCLFKAEADLDYMMASDPRVGITISRAGSVVYNDGQVFAWRGFFMPTPMTIGQGALTFPTLGGGIFPTEGYGTITGDPNFEVMISASISIQIIADISLPTALRQS